MTCPEEFEPLQDLSPRAREIVTTARLMLEEHGWEKVSMRSLADEIGIRASSLYKHFANKQALKAALIAAAFAESGAALRPVTTVANLLAKYRQVAASNPNMYRLITVGELDRSALPPGLEEWSGRPFYEATGDPYAAQALWAAAHGLVILELDARLPTATAPETTWRTLAERFS